MIEVSQFVPKWYEHYTLENDERDAASLVWRIAENPRLLELAGNPLLLTMMAVIYKHQDLPEKRWQLYQRCTAVLLEDWDVKRKKIDRDELLSFHMAADQKAEILQNIAIAMISRPLDSSGRELNAIGYEPLRDIIAAYLQAQYGKPPGEAAAIAVEILNHLRERTYILAETGDRVFGFVHRTFMEYFVARHILAEFNRNKANYSWLKSEVFLRYYKDDRWREPLLLLSGMLAGQGSPIREVVDALDQRGQKDRLAIPFAARCLGEAGLVPPEDREWASGIAYRLIKSLDYRPNRAHGGQEYVDLTVAAFGLLVSFVEIRPDTRELIAWLAGSRVVSNRIVGWQLELSLRSRVERRGFAIDGLQHRDQAVRRGAVNTLEREWPGDDRVFAAMIDRLTVERNGEVRQTLIAALDAGWPGRREVLNAIEKRIASENSYTHAIWVVEHLASIWRGDFQARDLVLKVAGSRTWAGDDRGSIVWAVASMAMVNGWSQLPDTEDLLKKLIDSSADYTMRLFAVHVLLEMRQRAALDWLSSRIGDHEKLSEQILRAVVEVPLSEHVAVEWLLSIATSNADPACRTSALELAFSEMSRSWLVECLVHGCAQIHPDRAVRGISQQLVAEWPVVTVELTTPSRLLQNVRTRRSLGVDECARYVVAGMVLIGRKVLEEGNFSLPELNDIRDLERELAMAELEFEL